MEERMSAMNRAEAARTLMLLLAQNEDTLSLRMREQLIEILGWVSSPQAFFASIDSYDLGQEVARRLADLGRREVELLTKPR
jgi:DNA-binding LacI/PurR family transcriptional regulator